MAKNNMKLKYKAQKRERNKKEEVTFKDQVLSVVKTVLGIAVFLGVCYGCVIGMEKLGLFEKGYTKPEKESATIDTKYIAMGNVFNRNDKEYYVLFDNYQDTYKTDRYINGLLDSKSKIPVYRVDMGQNENKKFISEEENKKATEPSELKINGITLIKIVKGKIDKYISGSETIEEYLNK